MRRLLPLSVLLCACAIAHAQPKAPKEPDQRQRLAETRREFQAQELTTAKSSSWIVPPDTAPRIIWRDPEKVRELGFQGELRVRWFDSQLHEAPQPNKGGRWLAWIEGRAPNGTPLRRGLTFYAIPKNFTLRAAPEVRVLLPPPPEGPAGLVWREHEEELSRTANEQILRLLLDSPSGAIAAAALAEWKPLGHPARAVDSAAVLNEDYHLALKLKLQGRSDMIHALAPPRRRKTPALALHEGSLAEAGMRGDAREKIAAVCQAWADDSGEPMTTLVARHGVVVLHQAFGKDAHAKPITTDYRCDVASITKTVTGILFSRFLDQERIALDDSVGKYFPDYRPGDVHTPTFRQCFNHTSGLIGHGDFGGCRNPHFENVVLNGLDANRPGVRYEYSGQGFELAVKAMENVCGRSAVRLYDECLFRPLGFTDVPMDRASSGGHFTAWELGVLAQWVANRGSYGDLEFIAPSTFQKLMPEPISASERGYTDDEGIGIHWIRHRKPGAAPNSNAAGDLLFSPATLGHGSFSGCVFLIDPQQELIITQARRQSGPRSEKWSPRFFQTVAAAVLAGGKPH